MRLWREKWRESSSWPGPTYEMVGRGSMVPHGRAVVVYRKAGWRGKDSPAEQLLVEEEREYMRNHVEVVEVVE